MTVFASCAAAVDVINPTSAMAASHFLVMYPSGMARREGKPPLRYNAARLHYVLARFCSSVSFWRST
jgi:hypothetical protein